MCGHQQDSPEAVSRKCPSLTELILVRLIPVLALYPLACGTERGFGAMLHPLTSLYSSLLLASTALLGTWAPACPGSRTSQWFSVGFLEGPWRHVLLLQE